MGFEALQNADCALILTEWNEYRNLDFDKTKSVMRGNLIYDARNVLDPEKVRSNGFVYMATGR